MTGQRGHGQVIHSSMKEFVKEGKKSRWEKFGGLLSVTIS